VAGTYPLPLPQLDRFPFKIRMEDIDRESELQVLRTRQARSGPPPQTLARVRRDEILASREALERDVHVSDSIHHCLVDLARGLRAHPQVAQGVSTRSLVLLLPALKAAAVLRDRDFVSGEDVAWLAPRVFAHRMELAPGAGPAERLIQACLEAPMEALSVGTLRRN
jgi:MoxR-like ATPase